MKIDQIDLPTEIQRTIVMLEELERFVAVDLSYAIGIAERVRGAFRGNPLDAAFVSALQRSQGHKPKGASHVRELFSVVRESEFHPASFPPDTSDVGAWEVRPPGPI